MAAYKNEGQLVDAIKKAIREKYPNSYVIKVNGGMYQESGIPDLLCGLDGLMIGIEVKHQKLGESREHALDRTTLKQRQHIARIVAAGGMAGVALDVETALHIIQLAKLKASMISRGEFDGLPLPPDWDFLMDVSADKVVASTTANDPT